MSDNDCNADGGAEGGAEICKGGSCTCTTTCGGRCVDAMRDPQHCGGCNLACQPNELCQAGHCTCPGTRCPGAGGGAAGCVDTMTDNANCGACGTACDYTCAGGVCGPKVVAAKKSGWLALDSTNQTLIMRATFPNPGFYKCPTAGCGGDPTFIAAAGQIGPLSASGGSFFFLDSSAKLSACAEANCVSPVALGNASNRVAVNATRAYWTDFNGNVMTSSTSAPSTPTSLVTASGASGVAVDGNDLYWGQATGEVYVSNLNGQQKTLIATDTSGQGATVFLAGGGRVFWIAPPGIMTASRTSPASLYVDSAKSLGCPGQSWCNGAATDGTNVYFLSFGNTAEVVKCPIGPACPSPVTLVPSTGAFLGPNIVVDDKNLYWFENENLVTFHK